MYFFLLRFNFFLRKIALEMRHRSEDVVFFNPGRVSMLTFLPALPPMVEISSCEKEGLTIGGLCR